MAISTKGRYSLRILSRMAWGPDGRVFTRHDLAESEGISPAYVQQLMMTLRTAGFVNSHRGKAGGFTLARDPYEITVADVLRATEGDMAMAPCLSGGKCERETACAARPLWAKASRMLADLFGGVSIADLARDDGEGVG